MSHDTEIAAVSTHHGDGWRQLFRDYCALGGVEATSEHLDLVWEWLTSCAAQTRGLVVLAEGDVVGFAHFRAFERPITGTTGLWIDDLYVAPAWRGRRLARALVDGVRPIARDEGHDVVRWTTKRSNAGSRRLYERIVVAAPVVLYNSAP